MFVYFYDEAGEQDGSVMIDFYPDGRVERFGWNPRDANDFSHPGWRPFEARASTQPAGRAGPAATTPTH